MMFCPAQRIEGNYLLSGNTNQTFSLLKFIELNSYQNEINTEGAKNMVTMLYPISPNSPVFGSGKCLLMAPFQNQLLDALTLTHIQLQTVSPHY